MADEFPGDGRPIDFPSKVLDAPRPLSDHALAGIVADDASRNLARHLLVPTVRRYRGFVEPSTTPHAAHEVVGRVLGASQGMWSPVAAILAARYPAWRSVLADACLACELVGAFQPEPDHPESVGAPLGEGERRYRIDRFVARGSGGTVAIATDLGAPGGPREVAVKFIRTSPGDDAPEREAVVAGGMCGPSAVRVIEVGRWAGGGYVVMDLVGGMALTATAAAERTVGAERIAAEVCDLSECLAELHDAGFVHGDISPTNVMLDDAGGLRLVDFGRAGPRCADAEWNDVRMLASLLAWMLLGYMPGPGFRPPALGLSLRQCLLLAVVRAARQPTTAREFATAVERAVLRARIQRGAAVVGAAIVAILWTVGGGR